MRRLTGFGLLTVLALLLVACGGDGDDDEATATVAPTEAVVATEVEPTTPPITESTPEASPASIGTPVSSPVADSTPVAPDATPETGIPASTPFASPAASPVGVDPVVPGTSGDSGSETQVLTGTVILPGTPNERFVIGDDGCIGLGSNAGLQAGQQVIIRNQDATIIGTANLSATSSEVVCSWTFEVEVEVSEYYEIEIPMRAEQVFSAEEVSDRDGQIDITLP